MYSDRIIISKKKEKKKIMNQVKKKNLYVLVVVVRVMVLNATFNNISVVSWQSVYR